MKKYLVTGLIMLIVAIAFFSRIYRVSVIPASLNIDETAIGYNAYSLLKTGADEHGNFFPLALESFGDWKLPSYPVATILPIIAFGLSEFSTRFVGIVSGVIGIILIYLLCVQLFKCKKLGLVAALFYALSPWGIYFSRMAYEVNLATTLFLAGVVCYLSAREEIGSGWKWLLGSVFFGLTMFTYHSYIILTPIYLVCIFALLVFVKTKTRQLIIPGLVVSIFASISLISVFSTSANKLSNLTVFNNANIIYTRADRLRSDPTGENPNFSKLFYNKFVAISTQVAINYLSSFSPTFLFDKGGEKLVNSLGYAGNLYLLDAPFLLFGFITIFWKKEKNGLLLLGWLTIAPLASAITIDAPSATRMYSMLPPLMIISGYGAINISLALNKLLSKRFVGLVISIFFAISVVLYFEAYYVHINFQRSLFLHYGYREIVDLSNKYKNYDVVMGGPGNFPYISFLFYNKYDPRLFWRQVVYYPKTPEGFLLVKSFGKYFFPYDIDYKNLKPDVLYIDSASNMATDIFLFGEKVNESGTISLPSGQPVFYYFTLKNDLKI